MTENRPTPSSKSANRSAWASLGCALLACIPPGAIFAIVFGVRGIKFARKNQNRGMIPAMLGLIGGVAGGSLFLYFIGVQLVFANGTRQFLREFIANLESGNLAAAQSQCDSTFSPDEIADLSDQIRAAGAVREISFTVPLPQSCPDNHGTDIRSCYCVGADAKFANSKYEIDAGLLRENGTYHLHRFKLR